jgi:hypothetical protein
MATPAQTPAPDIFDQVAAEQNSNATTPAAASAPPQSSGQGDIFTQALGQTAPQSSQTAQTQQPQQPRPVATIRATPGSSPNDPMAAKLALWAQNVQSDLMHGTDITGVGHVLKAMGAHGLASGTSEETAKFMGSLPLGLLRVLQGGAEETQHGQRWQGTKDIAGGALQAATIPGSFVAPEAGETADAVLGKASDAIAEQAVKAAKAVREPFSLKMIQPKIQGAITDAIKNAAQEHGISIPENTNVRDVVQVLSDAVRSKARGIYQQLDNALGGTRFQSWDDALENVNKAIRENLGIDPDKEAKLLERLHSITEARNAAMNEIRSNGLDPQDLIGQADRFHRQAMALGDVSKAVRASTDVHPSAAVDAYNGNGFAQRLDEALTGRPAQKSVPANVRTAPLFKRIQALATPNPKYPGTPSRLVQALGEQRAEALMNAVDAAHLYAQKVAARNQWLKRGATALGIYGLGREAFNGAHSLLSSGQ